MDLAGMLIGGGRSGAHRCPKVEQLEGPRFPPLPPLSLDKDDGRGKPLKPSD